MVKGIGSWLPKQCERFGDKTALVYREKRFTYAQFNERVNRLADCFLAQGVQKGTRVGAILFNTNEMIEVLFACAKIGAICVPINYRLSVDEIEYIANDAGVDWLFYDERMQAAVTELTKRKTAIQTWVHVGAAVPFGQLEYEGLLREGNNQEPYVSVHIDDVHMMMYTSGTTGKPKGVMLSHGNTLWNAINAVHAMSLQDDDSTLTVAPLFHIGGMNVFTTTLLYKGGKVVLHDKFDPVLTLETIGKEKITTLFMVPAMWLAIMHLPNFDHYDLGSLRLNVSGGAPCPLTVIEFFQKRNIPFYEGFGLTETAPFVALLDPANSLRKNGSIGKTPIHTDARVVNEAGIDVQANEIGELIVRGPNVMKGYWNLPEATQNVMKEGWFYTGDLARVDEEGFFYIVDRKKDMIITGGENVYPTEVEQVIMRYPGVREVAVIGVHDEFWGESVKAFVVLQDHLQSLTVEELRNHCEGKLAHFKMPKFLEIIPQLPRNATGKILKNVLREQGGK
ncbi:class I adenylate-forming enzyme family protein [Brevibacillus sp. H7]|uniref:class I adenylate-forming enzyme family protein n=1 Tax=Brevibacillus sp. H7 TaxID=3349138 RepID=UPI0037FE57DA